MLIALDFDGTYTADPILWDEFLESARAKGHLVACVTMRYPGEAMEVEDAIAGKVDAIIYTRRKAKRPYLAARGLAPDIWIDDNPRWVEVDAAA